MSDDRTWKILFFVCGDASDRLAPGQGGIDLAPLLAPDALPPGPSDAILLVQARLGANQPALRLVQLARPGAGIAGSDASIRPATARQRATTSSRWALRTYPTRHTLLDPARLPARPGRRAARPAAPCSA